MVLLMSLFAAIGMCVFVFFLVLSEIDEHLSVTGWRKILLAATAPTTLVLLTAAVIVL